MYLQIYMHFLAIGEYLKYWIYIAGVDGLK